MSTHFGLAGAALLCALVLNIVWRWWLLRKYRISSGVSLNRQVRSRFMFGLFAQPAQYVARKQSIVLDGPERIHRSCVHPSPQRLIENYHPDVRCDPCSYVVTLQLVPIWFCAMQYAIRLLSAGHQHLVRWSLYRMEKWTIRPSAMAVVSSSDGPVTLAV